jgi:hypothetical protein
MWIAVALVSSRRRGILRAGIEFLVTFKLVPLMQTPSF